MSNDTAVTKCRYMEAAYPDLGAEDTCTEHRHDEPTFALARALAVAAQDPNPSDEQIGWLLNDAAAVVDDFDPLPESWVATEPQLAEVPGLDFTLTINGRPYVIQESGQEETHPMGRDQWRAWQDEDCDHDWEIRPESDTRVCVDCGATR